MAPRSALEVDVRPAGLDPALEATLRRTTGGRAGARPKSRSRPVALQGEVSGSRFVLTLVFAINPQLPRNWRDLTLGQVSTGPDAEWVRACRGIVERHGRASLALDEVQRLVLGACDLCPGASIRNPRWIEAIPEAGWAVDTAWGEPSRRPFAPGSLWSAMQQIRAVDDELSVLRKLGASGFFVVPRERTDDLPDWTVSGPPGELHVEVKSKGGEGTAFEFLHAALNGVLLLDRIGGLRDLDWHIGSPSNEEGIRGWSRHEGRLDALVTSLYAVSEDVSSWAAGRLPSFDDRRWSDSERGVEVQAICCDDYLGLEFVDEPSGSRFTFHGDQRRDRGRPWVYHPGRVTAGYELDRVDGVRRRRVAKLLDRLLLKDGRRRGRQVARFPHNTLFLLRWHAPFFWDAALREHPEDFEVILQLLSRRAGRIRQGVGVAIWASSFASDLLLSNDTAGGWLSHAGGAGLA